MSCSAVFEQRSRFTAASIAIITTDTGETQAPKVGHEMSDVINTPSYTYYGNGGRELIKSFIYTV